MLGPRDLEGHAAGLAQRVASTGADVVVPRVRYLAGRLDVEISLDADLPGSGFPKSSQLQFVERWARGFRDQPWQLVEYTYELIDHERDSRRALHLHNADWFIQTYRVVVHEHCERPIGTTHCDHFAGTPVRDGYEALDRLMETWTHDDPVDCTSYACLQLTKLD